MTAKVITFSANKGGVGKTTLTFHFGYYLATQGKRVLLIDLDPQSSLSSNFKFSDEQLRKSDIYRLFEAGGKGNTEMMSLIDDDSFGYERIDTGKEKLELYGLSGDRKMSTVDFKLREANYGPMVLTFFFQRRKVDKDFDYILIDTHPGDFTTAARNALIISDFIFSPIEPSRFGLNSIAAMKADLNREKEHLIAPDMTPYITADLYFVPNRVKFNTEISHMIKELVDDNDDFIAAIHEREVFNKANLAKEYVLNTIKRDKSHSSRTRKVEADIIKQFTAMQDIVDSERDEET